MFPNVPFLLATSNANRKPGSILKKAATKSRNALAAAHRSHEDLQAYIFTFQHALVFADYLKYHFSVFQPKALLAKPGANCLRSA